MLNLTKRLEPRSLKKHEFSSLELATILGLGNGATLASWWLKIPINTGPFNLSLSLSIYAYLAWKNQLHKNFKLQKFTSQPEKLVLATSTAVVLTLPPIVFFKFPLLVGSVDYAPLKNLSKAKLAVRIFFELPLLTAISEEMLFRGYLYKSFETATPLATIWRNAGIFTLWHLVVVLRTVRDTNLAQNRWLMGAGYAGGLVSIFVGGLAFAWVRQRTDSFWYAALTHWLNVALMTWAIWAL